MRTSRSTATAYYQLKGKYATAIRGDWSDGQKAQIVVKSGTVFRDFGDDAIYAYGSIVTIEDGAVFENIRQGSAVFATGPVQKTDDKSSEVIVNGGTFRNNLYSCRQHSRPEQAHGERRYV